MADRDSTGLHLPIQGAVEGENGKLRDPSSSTNGATSASADPFVTPTQPHPHQRFAHYDDANSFSASMSPSQARRTLEIHLAETERRIKEASQLGTSLVQQQSNLTTQLQELQGKKEDGEIGEDLRLKLVNIEKEYNELGRDSARAFLAPRSRVTSAEGGGPGEATMLSSQATNSPSKLTVPSRKQRNQPSSRANDIEFAAEIGTSLLSQVRQLQTLLLEREDALKKANIEKLRLETEAKGLTQRLRTMDESEQRFKDENWNLETHTHELMAAAKDSSEREEKLSNNLKALTVEKTSVQKELDELRQTHGKLNDEHATITKHHEAEISGLRRNIVFADSEKGALQRKLDEVISQNEDLAKAAAMARSKPEHFDESRDLDDYDESNIAELSTPEGSPPPSPTKGTPRHTMLESETLKSSLHHSHRMIQTLKNNLHREKTERIELKRQLQDMKDELEIRRGQNGATGANGNKAKRSASEKDLFKKPAKPGMLGAGRSGTREVLMDEEDWEDQNGEQSPTRGPRRLAVQAAATPGQESSDAFETANERGDTATETEAFETGMESLGGNSSDDLTETETADKKAIRAKDQRPSSLTAARQRQSYLSTASTSNDESEVPEKAAKPPLLQRLKLKVNRGGSIRHQRAMNDSPSLNSTPPSVKNSPASFANSSPAGPPGQSLFAELGDFEEEMDEDGTPSKRSIISRGSSRPNTASKSRPSPLAVAPTQPRVETRDMGTMTDVHKEEPKPAPGAFSKLSTAVVAGASAIGGAGVATALGAEKKGESDRPKSFPQPDSPTLPDSQEDSPIVLSTSTMPMTPSKKNAARPITPVTSQTKSWGVSQILSEEIEPITPPAFVPSSAGIEPVFGASPVPIRSRDSKIIDQETEKDSPKSGILGTVFGWGAKPDAPKTEESQTRAVFSDENDKSHQPLSVVSGNANQGATSPPARPEVPVADQGIQTTLSSDEIENMLRARSTGGGGVPMVLPLDLNKTQQTQQWRLSTGELNAESLRPRKSSESVGTGSVSRARSRAAEATMARDEGSALRTHKRPSSSSSQRSSVGGQPHPPLPPDHRQAIAAAAQKSGSSEGGAGTIMGPPAVPASAYRTSTQSRPRTPSSQHQQVGHYAPTSPTSTRLQPRASGRVYSSRASESGTRRSSVTSFASELDERFNIRADGLPMAHGFEASTDPRMIQAITQTMIGEYLWKYTRRAGRGEMSANRHRRFFWVHPYTRTLYWSDKDPASAGRAQLKAKSVAIETVRVVSDDNPMPPGLHRKSLVVMTPGREVKFTATTGQRHETWFNALSYLLLRTGNTAQGDGNADYTAEELDEFNPSLLPRGRLATGSVRSFASRRTTQTGDGVNRNSNRNTGKAPVREHHQSEQQRESTQQQQGGSISRLSNYFVPSSMRGSFSSRRSRASHGGGANAAGSVKQNSIYEGNELHDSAEDVREAIERGEGGDGLENVRACCDGKHDVGHLSSKRSRTSAVSDHHHIHHHHHSHDTGREVTGSSNTLPR